MQHDISSEKKAGNTVWAKSLNEPQTRSDPRVYKLMYNVVFLAGVLDCKIKMTECFEVLIKLRKETRIKIKHGF